MKILIDEKSLQDRISEMALEIDAYYQSKDWYRRTQEPVVVIGILTGVMFFMADLVRKLSIRVELDFIRASTYPGSTTVAQKPKIVAFPTRSLRNAHILLIDDILDTGKTLEIVKDHLAWEYPESMRIAVLLHKPGKAPPNVMADFVGFDISDQWVAGYGMDINERHRERPFIFI